MRPDAVGDRETIHEYEGPTGSQTYSSGSCMLAWDEPTSQPDFFLGLSAGWYDLYWSELSDQYIEISDVPVGTYEIVATTQAHGIIELTPWDNTASVVIQLTNGQPTVLASHRLYARPPAL